MTAGYVFSIFGSETVTGSETLTGYEFSSSLGENQETRSLVFSKGGPEKPALNLRRAGRTGASLLTDPPA